MVDWKVSPILVPLISEERTEHPGMVIGTIGDLAHQNETSDHNPDVWGFVCAADFMIGPHFTPADAEYLYERIRILRDARTAYVIYNRRTYSASNGWIPRPYTGTDPHTNHVHVSVKHGSNPHPTTTWNIYPETDTTMSDQTLAKAIVDEYLSRDLGKAGGGDTVGRVQQASLSNGNEMIASLARIETTLTDLVQVLTAPPTP